jgi:hypothetical protein
MREGEENGLGGGGGGKEVG